MIVPRNRLLFWVALVVVPFALLAAVEPPTTTAALCAVGLFLLLVIVDALGSTRSLSGIQVELTPVVRLSKDRAGKLELRIQNIAQKNRLLRIAIPFPPQLVTELEEMDVNLPAGAEWSSAQWTCKPTERGNFRMDAVYVEGQSAFGFWGVRRRFKTESEIRVYPNLLTERRNLAALFLNRGNFGLHAQRQVGKGRDFEKLREYVPGDSFDEIHWKATARRSRPVTKVFQIERTQEIYVIIDASRLSQRRPTGDTTTPEPALAESNSERSPGSSFKTPAPQTIDSIVERFVTAALVLGLAAEQQGDLFGLCTFTDKVEKFVRAKNGKAHYSVCRDALYTLQPQPVSPDFDELCTFLRLRLRRRALLVFLTSLDDPALAESFVRNIDLLRRQHLVLVNMIQPPGTRPLFSRGDVETLDELYRELGGHLQWARLQELGKTLQRRGVQFSLLQNERLSADVVAQYLNVKRRQLI